MNRRSFVVASLCLLALLAVAFAKSHKPELPAMVTSARFIHVTTYYGSDLTNPRLTAEDRRAVSDVEQALRQWGRYNVTLHARDADIILLVRAAANANVRVGPNIGIGSGHGPVISTTAGGDVASNGDDLLAVYDGKSGIDSPALWRRTAHNGFGSDMVLFKAFKKAVEDSTTTKP